MASIRILPDILSNKIAAGEVVERPAAVVKELVENALDAGARRILIEVRNGGRGLIRVSDDGGGMGHDDALLAVERFATSKLVGDADLFAIRTLGFRGEALPSIAAVSRFTLTSRDAASDSGTRITIAGGRVRDVTRVGAPVGTEVAVAQLFFNTPARRKFLRGPATEMGHIGDALAGLALAWPGVRFRLDHNGRTVRTWPAAAEPLERVQDVLGREVRGRITPLAARQADVAVAGWVVSPDVLRAGPRAIHTLVNGRSVRDRVMRHAVLQGYAGRLLKGRYPLAVIHLTLPFECVDVNVHPTKHEIRFADARAVHDTLSAAVAAALERLERPAWQPRPDAQRAAAAAPPRMAERTRAFDAPRQPTLDFTPRVKGSDVPSETSGAVPAPPLQPRPDPPAAPAPAVWRDREGCAAGRGGAPDGEPVRLADLTLVGQVLDTYLVCDAGREMVLVDQHAAHERIVYEALRRHAAAGDAPVQQRLIPETIECDAGDARLLDALRPHLTAAGFDIEPFGGTTFAVRAVPALLAERPVALLIREVLADVREGGGATGVPGLERCLELLACHGAIRGGQRLDRRQMQALLRQLDDCRLAARCPHGRPVWVVWPRAQLEKAFKRRV